MTKTFYITYWASKHKKHITRQGKHDDKSRYGVAKNGNKQKDNLLSLIEIGLKVF